MRNKQLFMILTNTWVASYVVIKGDLKTVAYALLGFYLSTLLFFIFEK